MIQALKVKRYIPLKDYRSFVSGSFVSESFVSEIFVRKTFLSLGHM